MPDHKIIALMGPTGVGKSAVASALAPRVAGEIVNFDSVQVYRGFDIGSAKPDIATRTSVIHHLIDAADPEEHFDAASFSDRARACCLEVIQRDRTPILVGGTGFYLRALLAGLPELPPRDEALRARIRRIAESVRGRARLHQWLATVDPMTALRIEPADRHRVERALEVWILTHKPISAWKRPGAGTPLRMPAIRIVLTLPRPYLVEVLDQRVDLMYEEGLLAETSRLLERHPHTARAFGSIGYREAVQVLNGSMTKESAIQETKRRTRAYAKRQMTWFRGEQDLHWIDVSDGRENALERIVEIVRASGQTE